jgi:hypothetical protein
MTISMAVVTISMLVSMLVLMVAMLGLLHNISLDIFLYKNDQLKKLRPGKR